jgi:hypothetical protein
MKVWTKRKAPFWQLVSSCIFPSSNISRNARFNPCQHRGGKTPIETSWQVGFTISTPEENCHSKLQCPYSRISKCLIAQSMMALQSDSFWTSACTTTTSGLPNMRQFSATFSSSSTRRAAITSFAPRFANS